MGHIGPAVNGGRHTVLCVILSCSGVRASMHLGRVCVRLCARTASVPHSHRLNGMLLNRVTEAINRPDIWLVMVCKVCMPVCVCVCVCVCVGEGHCPESSESCNTALPR